MVHIERNMTIAAIQRLQFLIKSWMLQIMVEAFARSLIDKIILEAFDVVEPHKGEWSRY